MTMIPPGGQDGGADDEGTNTPIDLDARRPDFPLSAAWGGLERTLQRALDRVRAVRRDWSSADQGHRAALAWGAADVFRDFGISAHELAGQLEDFARRRQDEADRG